WHVDGAIYLYRSSCDDLLALLRENQSKISKGKLIVTAKLTGTGRAVDHEHIESILFIEQFSRVIRTEWQLRIIKKHIVRTFDRVFDSHSLREMRKPCVNVEFREVELVFVRIPESAGTAPSIDRTARCDVIEIR